jgi:hypothetical protein
MADVEMSDAPSAAKKGDGATKKKFEVKKVAALPCHNMYRWGEYADS